MQDMKLISFPLGALSAAKYSKNLGVPCQALGTFFGNSVTILQLQCELRRSSCSTRSNVVPHGPGKLLFSQVLEVVVGTALLAPTRATRLRERAT